MYCFLPSLHPVGFRILILDDEREMCVSLSKILGAAGFESDFATHHLGFKKLLAQKHYDLLIIDIRMPEISGLDLLQQFRAANDLTPVIVISGYASVDNIVAAMKIGALNFYQKPINIDMLIDEIGKVSRSAQDTGFSAHVPMVNSNNHKMKQAMTQAVKIAKTDAPVVIFGESGTGKELIANIIHQNSQRHDKPFIKVNCASIPESLFESELFGYEPGAFTDAKRLHRGRFEIADGGDLFFDEIAEMGMGTQAKLLRVLQEKEFERLGGSSTMKTDVRIISATNKDIRQLIEAKAFREDLYYRLAVVLIALPPLRERKEDIHVLARHFLEVFCAKYGRTIRRISPPVEALLFDHSWPGNVRELRNSIERAVIFNETDSLELQDFAFQYEPDHAQATSTLEQARNQFSREIIRDALLKSGGVKSRAAEMLKIHRKTLYNQIKKLGIE